ncbi:zinc carboxypeptidase-like [Anopheles cruzii]|uniref:zinc carboxypeptidase-like n=1 Tax=Anopheles cruzii TaxID=68878 RepID=UPI0022EC770F|nr:zinc carboxypeptidase-like [Anopheles cruzii]
MGMCNKNHFLLLLLIAFLGNVFGHTNEARYDNVRLYRFFIETEDQVKMLQKLENTSDSYSFMGHARHANQNLTVMVAGHKIAEITELMHRYQLEGTILLYNMQELIDKEKLSIMPKSTPAESFDWSHYHHLDSINRWLDWHVSHHPQLKTIQLDLSYEQRPLRGVMLSKDPANTAVFLECGIHAREWISPASCTFILNELLTSDRPDVQRLAQNFNWIIFPVVNPDGYHYTFEADRLWRKNTRPYGLCRGVDLNRNFASDWNGPGASMDPCRYDFAGGSESSEPETKSLAAFLRDNVGQYRIQTYFSIHSFSQLVMFPYGYTNQKVANYNDLVSIGLKGAQAIKNKHGKKYVSGATIETIYPTSGASVDWVYGDLGVPIVFTFELRGPPDSNNMFVLPANEIIPTAEELLEALIAMLDQATRLGYYTRDTTKEDL